jgi:hypothetical protein
LRILLRTLASAASRANGALILFARSSALCVAAWCHAHSISAACGGNSRCWRVLGAALRFVYQALM